MDYAILHYVIGVIHIHSSLLLSVTLSSELYLACMQVPNVTQLFQDVRSKHLVNGFDNQKHTSLCKLMKPSHSRNAKFLKLKWRKVECSVNQVGGAGNIFCDLFGNHHAGNTFWLDSSSTEMVYFFFFFLFLYVQFPSIDPIDCCGTLMNFFCHSFMLD